ncbi:NAD(P)-dependent dehydrogenase (short-subunit alcohol dehydrogenase family) [Actinocorallia herbida]|uniref:NAD(P)-dependent dehydrogenase (Short-subunit alcohol dehydrogenase family) n=1 Tax=Actinocorallia herbida TaxID=58109 RepID=A0A3N1D9D8_9ACTN|nr:SDR family oxidoreductase [Actinocorallia herbida]ROO90153.1 NAD(P)-dependent dehydrogenase (short-subunit alcohol dehydrogenase family) [Actinocorallia herbida]
MSGTRGVLEGRAGLITGAARGIGRAMALAFAAEGGRVIVGDIDDVEGRRTVSLIQEAGGTAVFVAANAAVNEDLKLLVASVIDHYGRLDWAVNNAGLGSPAAPGADSGPSDWARVMGVGLEGVRSALTHEVEQMRKQGGGGSIVNTAASPRLNVLGGLSPWVAAKSGVLGLTMGAALAYARDGIRVNALSPGRTLTPAVERQMAADPEGARELIETIPMGRLATPEEQAQAALWLCSPLSSYVTGLALNVDGGASIA